VVSELRETLNALFCASVNPDGLSVDKQRVRTCGDFQQYLVAASELQQVALDDLSVAERASFFINLYNVMVMHGILVARFPQSALDTLYFCKYCTYYVAGTTFSLAAIQHGILRCNDPKPFFDHPLIPEEDPRLRWVLPEPRDPRVLFTLCLQNAMSPWVFRVSPENISDQLQAATIEYLQEQIHVSRDCQVSLPSILQDFAGDFGGERALLSHFIPYHLERVSPALCKLFLRSTLEKQTPAAKHRYLSRYEPLARSARTLCVEKSLPNEAATWPSQPYFRWVPGTTEKDDAQSASPTQ